MIKTIHTLILLSLISMAWAQDASRIEARIGAWDILIDYTKLDNLPEGEEPFARVKLSSEIHKNHATMKAPFRAYFALWQHLNALSKVESSEEPKKLPDKCDGALLHSGNGFSKVITEEQAGMLIRLWLDIHQRNWDWNLDNFDENDKASMGWFGYQLRTHPFPPDGKFEQGVIPKK